ncbi:MAG: YitT family protein, partial [Oscillospiraceae bacterium]|nr:YitT family protein [Oscillospiraceae bacterium]
YDCIILLGQLTYHPVEDLLYGILLIMTTSIVLDKVMMFGTTKTEVKVISKKAKEITQEILSELDRGVTLLHGSGGYMQQETFVVLSVVSNYELHKVEKLVRRIDPECFVIINRVSEVWGRGFSLGKIYASNKDN